MSANQKTRKADFTRCLLHFVQFVLMNKHLSLIIIRHKWQFVIDARHLSQKRGRVLGKYFIFHYIKGRVFYFVSKQFKQNIFY